ncbi:11608_t:CDS:2, partial [Cetraspora pellucida]
MTEPTQETFNNFVQHFILQQKQLNKNIVQAIQNQVVSGRTSGTISAKGLSVQLSVFKEKEDENIKKLCTTMILKQVQGHLLQKPFKDWNAFEKRIKEAFPLYNISRQVDGMHEADKILYFTEGLKHSTKAEVSYRAPEKLNDAIKLATTEELRITEPVPMELDKVEASKYKKYKKGTFKSVKDSKKTELKRKGEELLRVKSKIDNKEAMILIDSGTSKDFINKEFVEKHQIPVDQDN